MGGGIVRFVFENIMLPDSNVNEATSHGFVKFTIHPRSDVPLGTSIPNSAAIYFDFNEPVITNTSIHTNTNTNPTTTTTTTTNTTTASPAELAAARTAAHSRHSCSSARRGRVVPAGVTRYTPFVTRHTQHVKRSTLHARHHTSRVTHSSCIG
jgi:hypothetical protein